MDIAMPAYKFHGEGHSWHVIINSCAELGHANCLDMNILLGLITLGPGTLILN